MRFVLAGLLMALVSSAQANDAELRQRLIQGGRSRVQEFSRERMAEKFRALLAGRPRRPRGLRRCARANPTD